MNEQILNLKNIPDMIYSSIFNCADDFLGMPEAITKKDKWVILTRKLTVVVIKENGNVHRYVKKCKTLTYNQKQIQNMLEPYWIDKPDEIKPENTVAINLQSKLNRIIDIINEEIK